MLLYAVGLLTGPSLGALVVINWSKFVCLLKLFVKNTIKQGLQHIFIQTIARANFNSYKLVQGGLFWTPNLDQLITLTSSIKNGRFLFFCFKIFWNTYCYISFEHQPKFAKKGRTERYKKTLLQPPSWPNIGVFQLGFFETKNNDVEQ